MVEDMCIKFISSFLLLAFIESSFSSEIKDQAGEIIAIVPSLAERLASAQAEKAQFHNKILEIVLKNPSTSPCSFDHSYITILGLEGTYPLSQDKALEMVCRDSQGGCLTDYKHCRHPVLSKDGMHFKASFYEKKAYLDFAREESAYYFMKLLLGEGIAPSAYCIFNQVPIEQIESGLIGFQQFTSQISSTIEGVNMHHYLCDLTEDKLQNMDYRSVSAHLLTSLLLLTRDAKADNFMRDSAGKLWCVDSDLFYPIPFSINFEQEKGAYDQDFHFSKTSEHLFAGEKSVFDLNFRNIFFLLPYFMNQIPHIDVQNYIMATSEEDFFCTWLKTLDKSADAIGGLILNGTLPRFIAYKDNFPYAYTETSIRRMVFNLRKMKILIDRGLTHQEIFRNLYPLLFLCYNNISKNNGYDFISLNEYLYSNSKYVDYFLNRRKKYILKDGRSVEEAMMDEKEACIKEGGDLEREPYHIVKRLFPKNRDTNSRNLVPSVELMRFIKVNRNIKYPPLSCRLVSGDLFQEQGEELKGALSAFKDTLKVLNLRDNWLPSSMIQWLCPILSNHTSIQILNLSDNDLRSTGMKELVPVLAQLPNLHTLNLSANNLGNESLKYFISNMNGNFKSLKNLFLCENRLNDDSGEDLVKVIKNFFALERLDLRWNNYTDSIAVLLFPLLKNHLTQLCLKYNALSSDKEKGIRYFLVRKLAKNFVLSTNVIQEKFLKGALLNLKVNMFVLCQIQKLSRGETSILKFDQISMKMPDLYALTMVLNYCPNITSFSLAPIYFPGKGSDNSIFINFVKNLKGLTQLKDLRLSRCHINNDDVSEIVDIIKSLSSLKTLNLSYNQISDEGALSIVGAVKMLPTFQELTLFGNNISHNMQKHIREMGNIPLLGTVSK